MRCLVWLTLVVVLTACTTREAVTPAADAWVVTRLYLGTGTPNGPVAEDALAHFLATDAVAAFPDGMTRYDATGQWRGMDGRTAQERTIVLEIVHHPCDASSAAATELAREYRRRFHQESVLLTEEALSTVEFIAH
jgi:hypothetical protein